MLGTMKPTPNPSQEGNGQKRVLPSWEGSGVGRFMESSEDRSRNFARFRKGSSTTSFGSLNIRESDRETATQRAALMNKASLSDKFALIHEHWRPKMVAELNGQELK